MGALSRQLASPAHRFSLFPRTALGRLFIMVAALHLAEGALPLHFLFERFQRLIDVVVAYEDLNDGTLSRKLINAKATRSPLRISASRRIAYTPETAAL